ncbi:hypothetical protein AgCh_003365 [Apium graveolens]
MANNVQGGVDDQQNITMTSQQLEQILKLIPKEKSNQKGSETDEEIDYGFSGMVCSGGKKVLGGAEWIIDSGASDHMTSSLQHMINIKLASATFIIILPTGSTAVITHIGDVILENGLKLKNVLHVPQFNHNLLSIRKLSQDCKCEVIFGYGGCVISDSVSKSVVGVGEIRQGQYYLRNKKIAAMQAVTGGDVQKKLADEKKRLKNKSEGQYDLWHKCLGHASHSKMQHISLVKPYLSQHKDRIKVVRSDNALEFAGKACTEYFAKKGMIHQKSCPHTPQQNARVERKHRRVLEMARALRFQSGLALSYWGGCVLSAVYIINRLPNAALNFEVPFEKLYNEQVDYEYMGRLDAWH